MFRNMMPGHMNMVFAAAIPGPFTEPLQNTAICRLARLQQAGWFAFLIEVLHMHQVLFDPGHNNAHRQRAGS